MAGLLFCHVASAEGRAAQHSKATKPAAKGAPAAKRKLAKGGQKPAAEARPSEDATPAAAEPEKPALAAEPEPKLRPAGTSVSESAPTPRDVKEKEGPEGVKTYQFGAIEVEGRQKSPQLIYFLRRVRAEFDAGALGHRSFLGELSDTRNDSALR